MRTVTALLLLISSYRLALPGYQFEFPRDHGNHPESKLEWWYYTGHLDTPEGRSFGYELTFFRTGVQRDSANPSRWSVADLYPAHFALSDLDGGRFHYFEKLNRQGPGIAGAIEGRLEVWNENWRAFWQDGVIRIEASEGEIGIDLVLELAKPPIIHGRNGVSQKSEAEGRASHYYSLTRLLTRGQLRYGGEVFEVTGESWMDHEFGTNQLDAEQVGWDWFSLQFGTVGEELMLFQIRRDDGSIDRHSAGTAIDLDGRPSQVENEEFRLRPLEFWVSPRTSSRYPVRWRIEIPSLEADLLVHTLLPDQELVTTRSTGIAYWEGAVKVSGIWKGRPVEGRGYLEMTGYQKGMRPRI